MSWLLRFERNMSRWFCRSLLGMKWSEFTQCTIAEKKTANVVASVAKCKRLAPWPQSSMTKKLLSHELTFILAFGMPIVPVDPEARRLHSDDQ
jgi:hypothetical protein